MFCQETVNNEQKKCILSTHYRGLINLYFSFAPFLHWPLQLYAIIENDIVRYVRTKCALLQYIRSFTSFTLGDI